MDISDILGYTYIGCFVIFGAPIFILMFSWLGYISYQINVFYKKYKKLRFYSELYSDFYMDFFNCKVKLIIYLFFLFLIFSELMSIIGYSVGTLLLNFYSPAIEPTLYPLLIPLNCSDPVIELWQLEIANPLVAFFFGVGNMSYCAVNILLTGLFKFIFQAYQNKSDFRSVKKFLFISSFFGPFIFILSVIPQTQIISKIFTSMYCIILFILVLKYKKQFFLILKWRCDEFFIQQDTISHTYHSKIRRNSKLSLNFVVFGSFLFLCSIILTLIPSFLSMLLTEKSKYVTNTFNLDINLSFLDCRGQQIFYHIRSFLDNIVPLFILVGMTIYSLPMFILSLGLIACYFYNRCKRVDTRYFHFKGNADYFIHNHE